MNAGFFYHKGRYFRFSRVVIITFLVFAGATAFAQPVFDSMYAKVAANDTLIRKSSFYQWQWGRNRRAEWAAPVHVPVLWLDKYEGGLIPYEAGGGNETKSMHLRSTNGHEYALRSINKSREAVVPPGFGNTFVAAIIKDQISASYPYGAWPVTIMQAAAGIHHTNPRLFYVPAQPALDSFSARFGNDLYLLEERADGDWSESASLGHFSDFASTEKVIRKVQEDTRRQADQFAFIKARLFDMLIGDWDRHEDNWRWGESKSNGITTYVPIPRDRDQAFYTHNGVLLDFLLPTAGFSYMQDFSATPGNMRALNAEERNMDPFFSSAMSRADWLRAATELQDALTDSIIRVSVAQLPTEIFAISGEELIQKLISRRTHLPQMAVSYYEVLAKEVEIVGSKKKEHFEIDRHPDSTTITIRAVGDNAVAGPELYRRSFYSRETEEIRIFGIGGEDVFQVKGDGDAIRLRIIGGPDRDSMLQVGRAGVFVYDDRNNAFQLEAPRWRLSSRTTVHEFDYESHDFSTRGWGPVFSYDHEDRVYVGLSYRVKKHRWRRTPYASQHIVGVNYSITQHSVSTYYAGVYPRVAGGWDLMLNAKFDAAGWVNFAGPGNETVRPVRTNDYYQMRGGVLQSNVGLHRAWGRQSLTIGAYFQRVTVTEDSDRYAAKVYQINHPYIFDPTVIAGLRLSWTFLHVNDRIVPTRGVSCLALAVVANDFERSRFFETLSARMQAWVPLSHQFSLSIKAGGTTVIAPDRIINTARPFEHAIIGGPETFRGYRIERFWGKTSFYNNNELRFITPFHSYLFNARIGLIAFFDDGRVWMPNEVSHTLHTAYGGGLLIAPFNQFSCTLTYGKSQDGRMIQFRFNTLL